MAKNTNTQTTETTETAPIEFNLTAKYAELGSKKSPLIRFMASLPEFQKTDGKADVGKINKAFEVAGVKMRYQHVRNVLTQTVKKA